MGRHRQFRIAGGLPGFGRVENQEHRVPETEEDMPVPDTSDCPESERLPIEPLCRVKVFDVDGRLKNV